MKQLQAVIERLPSYVEYAFVQAIFAALPPVREAAVWVTAAPTDEILSVFNYGTYGAVDRLLRQHEKALVRLPENGPNTARTLLDAVRHSLAQLLMAEASAKAKAPGDCRLERRWVRGLGSLSDPCPFSGPGMLVDVWQLGRDRRMHRLAVEGIAAVPRALGGRELPWVDPVAFDKCCLALLRKYCRSLFRLRVGHAWRTRRTAPSGWRVLTQRVIPRLYDYFLAFYPIRRYTWGGAASRGKYPRALLRDIRDLLAVERPDLAADLTEEQVRAAVQRYLDSAPRDRSLGRAMFQLYPKPATAKRTTRPRS